jgi:hypothetical protein
MLTGILVSDQPWIVPEESRVFISPGLVGSVTFHVVRSRRPQGAEGALVANLSLIYVDGGGGAGASRITGATPGVSVALVTVVDVSRPSTSSSTIPPGTTISWFVPGVSNFVRGETSFFSDVALLNNSLGRPASDVRLYFTPAASQLTTVATLSPIPATNSVTLANILSTVYQSPAASGSLQIRSTDWQNIVVQAKLLGLSERGSVAGEVPVFRSDRSIASTGRLYLAGLRPGSAIYVQETSGIAANVSIEFLDADGRRIGEARTAAAPAWGVVEVTGIPAGAVTALVTNNGIGSVAAYARVFDDGSGDHWSVVDWSRVHAYELGEVLRVPFLNRAAPPPGGGGRRRAVAHGASAGSTELTLFNPTEDTIAADVEVFDAGGAVARREQLLVGPSRTVTRSVAGAHARITPLNRGKLVVSARDSGTSVPVIPAASGLRLGRSQIFSNLEDSTAATVAAATPGTYRTTLGMVETGGATAVVRARIYLDEGRGLANSVIYRDFTVRAGEQLVLENLVRAIVGESRETRLGELHNLQLRLEVISGAGAVVPFVILTDNGTGDSLLRLD